MSPSGEAERSEQRSGDDGFGTRGGSRSDGRAGREAGPGLRTVCQSLQTGTDDGAGYEAGFVTSNGLRSLSGRLDGRLPEIRIRSP